MSPTPLQWIIYAGSIATGVLALALLCAWLVLLPGRCEDET